MKKLIQTISFGFNSSRKGVLATMIGILLFQLSNGSVFTVNSLSGGNSGTGNSGTLYYCITKANGVSGPHTIQFSLTGNIKLTVKLPELVQQIFIDGSTAPGYFNLPVITIDGSNLSSGDGLVIETANCKILGIDINQFPYSGLVISGDAAKNFQIGSKDKGNTIRNNGYYGIEVNGADNGKIIGNKIGTDHLGLACASNQYYGILLTGESDEDSILFNTISCNKYCGIRIDASDHNVIQGNQIGGLKNGCVGNGYDGIRIENFSSRNIVGGAQLLKNEITRNEYSGIAVYDSYGMGNILSQNSFYCNGYVAVGIKNGSSASTPVIETISSGTIKGTGLAGAKIEIYKAQKTQLGSYQDAPSNQGTDFIGTTLVDGTGKWNFTGSFDGYISVFQYNNKGDIYPFSKEVYSRTAGRLVNTCKQLTIKPGDGVIISSGFSGDNRYLKKIEGSTSWLPFALHCNKRNASLAMVSDTLKQVLFEMVAIEETQTNIHFYRTNFIHQEDICAYPGLTLYSLAYDMGGDKLYTVGVRTGRMNDTQTLYTVDKKTGKLSSIGNLGITGFADGFHNINSQYSTIISLFFDSISKVLLAGTADSKIFSIDPSTGKEKFIAKTDRPLKAFAWDYRKKKLFAHDTHPGYLYEINRINGSVISKQDAETWILSMAYAPWVSGNGSAMKCDSVPIKRNLVFVSQVNSRKVVSIYPNPNKGNFKISTILHDKPMYLKIYDQIGRLIFESEIRDNSLINMEVKSGIYFISILQGDEIYQDKIVIE